MEAELTRIYQETLEDIDEKTSDYLRKFEKEDERYRQRLNRGEISNYQYKSWRKRRLLEGDRWAEYRERVAYELANVNEIAAEYVNEQLYDVYLINYRGEAMPIQRMAPLVYKIPTHNDFKTMVLNGNKSFLPFVQLDPVKDIPWNMRKLNSAIMQGIVLGESIPKISKRIIKIVGDNKTSAVRTARTVVTTVENKAGHDAAVRAERYGCMFNKYWLSIADTRTRDWHIEANARYGENGIPLDQYFIVDGEKMLYPGDKYHGATGKNLYNCRCRCNRKVIGFNSVLPKRMQNKITIEFVVSEEEIYE